MIYNKLTINLCIRIILLTLTCIALSEVTIRMKDPIIILNLVILIILQVYLFIRNMNQVNLKLTAFFESLRYDDINLFINRGFNDPSFKRLYHSMQQVLEKIQNMNLENEKQKQYFRTITEHAGVGLLVMNEKGEIKLMNQTLKQLLRIGEIKKINDLDRIFDRFSEQISNLGPAEQKLINIKLPDMDFLGETVNMDLSIKSATIRFDHESTKIITFQNIDQELEDREMESWQKIIRVLTHEIMNSTGPINSASQTLTEIISDSDHKPVKPSQVNEENIADMLEGLNIIKERSTGLEEYVKQFRRITLLSEPMFESIILETFFQRMEVLFNKIFKEHKIEYNYFISPENLSIYADRNMMEQLFINLINNSVDALNNSELKNITLSVQSNGKERISIYLTDTGRGIPAEDTDKVFIPFFTRKEHGSGIGLSLARKIMLIHGGRIKMKSEVKKGTTIILEGILAG
jgi:two-component system nitrogen regulation sensor histidine kinase NtrY